MAQTTNQDGVDVSEGLTLYEITMNYVGVEVITLYIQSDSRSDAEDLAKYNIAPRATIREVTICESKPDGETVHEYVDGEHSIVHKPG